MADFGIALAASKAGASRMTETGMSLGTPHYMSPEQAMGEREITARSDVYALGAVLDEMLTAEPLFTGATAQAVVARVVTESPRPLIPQRHTIPRHVEVAVLTALEKLPSDRFATAAALWGWLRPAPVPLLSQFSLALKPNQALQPPNSNGGARIALSHDGRTLAYIGPAEGGTRLWLRRMDQLDATPIAGTEGASNPFFSPDGGRVGVHQERHRGEDRVARGRADGHPDRQGQQQLGRLGR